MQAGGSRGSGRRGRPPVSMRCSGAYSQGTAEGVSVDTHMYTTYIHACVQTRIQTYVSVQTYMHINVYSNIYVFVHTYMHIGTCIDIHAYLHICMCVCRYMCTCVRARRRNPAFPAALSRPRSPPRKKPPRSKIRSKRYIS